MKEIKEFEILQFQCGQINRVRETTPDLELSDLTEDDTVSIDIQAEIGWAETDQPSLSGIFVCSLQTNEHILFAEFRAAVEGLELTSRDSSLSSNTKSEMFHLVYPYIRSSLVTIGRVADITFLGLPLSASFVE